jgi:hypothetical protein
MLEKAAVQEAVNRFRQQAVAGIVIVSPQSAMVETFAHLPGDVPTVAIWGRAAAPVPIVVARHASLRRRT